MEPIAARALHVAPHARHTLVGPPVTFMGSLPLIITLHHERPHDFDSGAWVRTNEAVLSDLLTCHGVLLLRGFVKMSSLGESSKAATPRDDRGVLGFATLIKGFTQWRDLPYEDSLSFGEDNTCLCVGFVISLIALLQEEQSCLTLSRPSVAVRLPVIDRVCTTNEAKNGGMMFHHEQAGS